MVGMIVLLQGSASAESQTPPVSTIGPGDVLEISVLGIEELSRRVRVLGDGTITLPLLGNFAISSFSVKDAEDQIARLLAAEKLVNDPQVSIFIIESVSGAVSVQGAVRAPGAYDLLGGGTLLEIIGRSGGVTQNRGEKILIVRGSESSAQETIEVDASLLLQEGDATQNVKLSPGDIVIVPAARRLRVYVTGAVRQPGAVDYLSSEGITVLQAITAAGGPSERANLKKVTIKRRNPDGSEDSLGVNVKAIQKGKAEDILLRRNDTVVVGEWLL